MWLVYLQQVEWQIKEGVGVWYQDGVFLQQCFGILSFEMEQLDRLGFSQLGVLGIVNFLLVVFVLSFEYLSLSVWLLFLVLQMFFDGLLVSFVRVLMFLVLLFLGFLELGFGCVILGFVFGFLEFFGFGFLFGVLFLQERRYLFQEVRSLDLGIVLQEVFVGNLFFELSEENFDGKFVNLIFLRMVLDLEVFLGWDCVDLGFMQLFLFFLFVFEIKRFGQVVKKEMKEFKKGEFWFFCWLFGKKKIEVYLLDDKNKLIVWDEKKNQWVNLNELEEEKKVLFLFLILMFKIV